MDTLILTIWQTTFFQGPSYYKMGTFQQKYFLMQWGAHKNVRKISRGQCKTATKK